MKRIFLTALMLSAFSYIMAQPTGYYNGTEGKSGNELKTVLHNIIKGHKAFSYTDAWSILMDSDQDPNNADNVVLIYDGRSRDKDWRNRGTDFDYAGAGYSYNDSWEREHVWAKSHGDFGTEPPMGTDVHNLKPIDRNVNSSRGELDFDNGGTPHDEATTCNYDLDSWEPRPQDKGDIARIIFYMDVRYEGDAPNERNLTVVDHLTDLPNPELGVLSKLLEWHRQDPPNDFERRRNDRIASWQGNRNPFIDHPEYADLIWGNAAAPAIKISNITLNPQRPTANDAVNISADVSGTGLNKVELFWGLSYSATTNKLATTANGNIYSAQIPAQAQSTTVFYRIDAYTANDTISSGVYSYTVPKIFSGTLKTIKELQGQSAATPFNGQSVSTTGIVTGALSKGFYIQNGKGTWSGVYVYTTTFRPAVGDSVIITGTIKEYFNLTEIDNLTFTQIVSSGHQLPEPIIIQPADFPIRNSAISEQYEGVLVKIENVICSAPLGQYGLWKVAKGNDTCIVHNPTTITFNPTKGAEYSITGVGNYDFNEYKIDIRTLDDIQSGADRIPPTISAVVPLDATQIAVVFSENMDKETSETAAYYTINNGVTVVKAEQSANVLSKITLTVTGIKVGDYTLTVTGATDGNGNATNNTFNFKSPYTNIEKSLVFNTLQVYPNPAQNLAYIQLPNGASGDVVFNVTDMCGKSVLRHIKRVTSSEQTIEILTNDLSTGLYRLQMIAGNNAYNTQLLIVR